MMLRQNTKTNIIPASIILTIIFAVFVLYYEKQTADRAQETIYEHAHIIADDLWNFNYQGAREYLQLVAESNHYQKLSIISHNGDVFQEVTTKIPSSLELLGLKLHLVHQVSLIYPVQHENFYIGWVEAIWIPQTLFTHMSVFSFLALVLLVIYLYQRVLSQNRHMERKINERTADLLMAKTEAEKLSQHLAVIGAEVQALLDNSPVGILFVDFDRVIKRANPEITRITGYSQEELIGSSTEKLYASQEIYESHGKTNYPILLQDGYVQVNTEIIRKDGSTVMCYWHGKVIKSEDGMDGVIWSLEDITLRLKMEAEILKVRKLESIGVLAGGIAHDFNNILLAIIGNISLAEKMTEKNSELGKMLSSAKKASLRAKELTSRLLTFSGGGEPIRVAGSLPELVKESATFVLSGSNVRCIFDFPENLWSVSMDKTQINQVIQNLVLNADQSMLSGGEITISCQNTNNDPVSITGLPLGRYVRLAVQDNGAGIPKEHIDRIFDPYYSTKGKDSNKGSGLGLAIVHSIIIKHKGLITAESELGKGSTFIIYLPATGDSAKNDSEIESAVLHGKGKILVMDDEETVLSVACAMLGYLGYETEQARNGNEAISLYEENFRKGMKFDAVIMDLTIPGGMGGAQTITRLLEIDPDVKAIVSSGYSSDIIFDNLEESGFCNIVPKPYQIQDLSRVISEVLTH